MSYMRFVTVWVLFELGYHTVSGGFKYVIKTMFSCGVRGIIIIINHEDIGNPEYLAQTE